jgi:DNA-binding transcriptional MerR regulator
MKLTTSDAARMLGVSADSVRLWARAGKLRAEPTPSGIRVFDEAVVRRFGEARARKREQRRSARAPQPAPVRADVP